MKDIVRDIVAALRESGEPLSEKQLNQILFWYNRGTPTDCRRVTKKKLMPYYRRIKREEPWRLEEWGMDSTLEQLFLKTVQIKPRRTASGVATITVLTKPWYCGSDCNYCPNDIRMPKSYLSDEPACQRAEQCYFDPYIQVAIRLTTLLDMGHPTDKIELIILGSTWDDYEPQYRHWFVHELFAALNDAGEDLQLLKERCEQRKVLYQAAGISLEKEELQQGAAAVQAAINRRELNYTQAFRQLYGAGSPWSSVSQWQHAEMEDIYQQHQRNVNNKHRVVGLVMETRPDKVNFESLLELRNMGATKLQIGIQSLDDKILRASTRLSSRASVERAFALLRLFGFKIHVHYMCNLLGSTPEIDAQGYHELVTSPLFLPDEIKLYPCVLVESSELNAYYEEGTWQPYAEEELVELLAYCVEQTAPYTRISRMIRDISTHDIKAGNKKTNLRQLVEQRLEKSGQDIQEIRYREIATEQIDKEELTLACYEYYSSVSTEYFLQYISAQGKIAGFLRLSLPKPEAFEAYGLSALVQPDAQAAAGGVAERAPAETPALVPAMIREVHVYGGVVQLQEDGFQEKRAQHIGLGKSLIAKAEELAAQAGYTKMRVISAVGTRAYYAKLAYDQMSEQGFYQTKIF